MVAYKNYSNIKSYTSITHTNTINIPSRHMSISQTEKKIDITFHDRHM